MQDYKNMYCKLQAKYQELSKENEKLNRRIFGQANTIKNLQEKLGKRNDNYCGEKWDSDPSKVEWHE